VVAAATAFANAAAVSAAITAAVAISTCAIVATVVAITVSLLLLSHRHHLCAIFYCSDCKHKKLLLFVFMINCNSLYDSKERIVATIYFSIHVCLCDELDGGGTDGHMSPIQQH
jgi:hypothetical protein